MPSSYRTPLGRVRWLGSARLGAEDNWRMRVTSLALVPLSLAFVVLVLTLLHKDYNGARAAMGEPLPAVARAAVRAGRRIITPSSACAR